MRQIAIAGPDGAGKTSVCGELCKQLPKCGVVYAGKARNQKLRTTRFAYAVWQAGKQIWRPLDFFLRYFWFYPFEFFEYRARFHPNASPGLETMIYDRHPVDRMVLPHDILLKRNYGKVSTIRYACELPPRLFWSWVYRRFFRFDGTVFLLLPKPDLCFARAPDQYQEIIDATIRIESYRRLAQNAPTGQRLNLIEISAKESVHQVAREVRRRFQESEEPFKP